MKVGYSTNPEARVVELQTGNWRPLRLLAKIEGTETDEKALHVEFIEDNLVGEWFKPSEALLSRFGLSIRDLC